MDKFKLNMLYERAPVTSMQANRTQDIKAERLPTDKYGKVRTSDTQINKIMHHIKTKGNSPKAQRALLKAKQKRIKALRKI